MTASPLHAWMSESECFWASEDRSLFLSSSLDCLFVLNEGKGDMRLRTSESQLSVEECQMLTDFSLVCSYRLNPARQVGTCFLPYEGSGGHRGSQGPLRLGLCLVHVGSPEQRIPGSKVVT
ncbi:hypothetical protein H920_16681 [Fukomys damarensis]|uniref:Uncharacterized protein n=1 Tax=Fukomys damarensis TaxID=885580 RepID=A0A091CRP4_FUKDA|nr:hypothetical protein H920_16681 [Fukomys damarensis]